MTIKLHLNAGDRVRNIYQASGRFGWVGFVEGTTGHNYRVRYSDGATCLYVRVSAHRYIELVGDGAGDCRRQEQKTLAYAWAYGAGLPPLKLPGRTTLSRVRRNVITGRTQDDMVKELGAARGVQQFNTRATGRSTGIAYRIVGEAMCNPGCLISYKEVDHVHREGTQTPHRADDNFFHVILDVIRDKNGFTCNKDSRTIMFNPIVTEETYVTRSH